MKHKTINTAEKVNANTGTELVFKLVTKKKFVKLEEMDIHPYKG